MDLFTSFEKLGLRNRSVMAPITRFHSDRLGNPTSELAEYYIRRAKANVGLVIVESCAINSADAMGYLDGMQFHSKAHVNAWRPIVEQIHNAGAKVWIQLFHAGRLTVPEITGGHVFSPSAIKLGEHPSFWRRKIGDQVVNFQTNTPYRLPQEISKESIKTVIKQFTTAAAFAEEAGFDGVEIHGAHGYLIHTFMTKRVNYRSDEYAESDKFVAELIEGCRRVMKSSTILSFRCSVHMVDNPMIRYSKDDMDFELLVRTLEHNGVDVLHCSQIDSKRPLFGFNKTLHKIVRELTDLPIVVCGGIKSLAEANTLISEDINSLIAFGRNFIPNPGLIDLFKNNRESEILSFDYEKHINTIY
jgi:2,4-dienoyl-CoA reductase-like NADH-dependent reductase (Old Yellow Enzyme family)